MNLQRIAVRLHRRAHLRRPRGQLLLRAWRQPASGAVVVREVAARRAAARAAAARAVAAKAVAKVVAARAVARAGARAVAERA